jgi:hypothetical protein
MMSNDEPHMSRRDPLVRALAGYDPAFERKLVDEITEAIADASMMSDGDGQVLVLRVGEIASALTTILASTLAVSPSAVRSPKAIREVADAVRRKLQARVRHAERDPAFADLKSRCFHDGDRERGGRA